MISFSQIIILCLLSLLIFGDIRQIFQKIILFFVNFKTIVKKVSSKGDDKKDSTS